MKKMFLFAVALVTLLCSCSLNDVTVNVDSNSTLDNNDSLSDMSNYSMDSDNSKVREEIERNLTPKIGEKFYCYPFTKSGTIYVAVTGAEYYDNILDSGVQTENFDDELLENNNLFDKNTGELFTVDGVENAFILVHITMENIDAVSPINEDSGPFYKGIDPELYGDEYCGEYDFSASNFGINTDKKSNAEDTANIGNVGVDYFSLKGQCYSDCYRSFLFNLKPGKSVSFDIGKFVPKKIANDEMVKNYGGKTGDELLSRYMLNLSNNPHDICVKLNLKKE